VTGVPLPTLVDIDRKLVKANLRTKHGRGRNAAQMTGLDAARLLTALLASAQATASVEAVERYAQTRVDRARSSETLYETAQLEELTTLPARHSFVDALAALIGSAATGSLANMMFDAEEGWIPRIEIFAFTRATRGRIRIAGLPNGLTASVEYAPPQTGPRSRRPEADHQHDRCPSENPGDLEQSRRITERTLLSVATLLAEEGQDDGS
jgi:hypothetical protein